MKTLFAILIIFIIFPSFQSREASRHTKVYKIDLDLTNKQRYQQIITENQQQIKAFLKVLPIAYWNHQFYGLIDQLYQQKQHNQFIQDLQDIADLISVDLKYLIAFNFVYEEAIGCTSILYKSKGQICLGRNLDYGFRTQMMNLEQQAHYYKNGQLVLVAGIVPGIIGTHTAMRVGQYSLSLNQRTKTFKRYYSFKRIIIGKLRPIPYIVLEQVLENGSFGNVVQSLKKVDLDAPAYFNIVGLNEQQAVVITRSYNQYATEYIGDNQFMVQTNYDRTDMDPIDDNRRTVAENMMKNSTEVSNQAVFEILLVPPVFQKAGYGTIETIITCPKDNLYQSTVWLY